MRNKNLIIFIVSITPALLSGFINLFLIQAQHGEPPVHYLVTSVLPFLGAIVSGALLFILATHCFNSSHPPQTLIYCVFIIAAITPLTTPPWLVLLATFAGFILSCKSVNIGGLTHSINAAIAARFIVFLCHLPQTDNTLWQQHIEGYSGATPLQMQRICAFSHHLCPAVSLKTVLLGTWNGAPGETSKIAILAGALLLLWCGSLRLRPIIFGLLGFTMTWSFFRADTNFWQVIGQQMLMGSFLFALIFMLRNRFLNQLSPGYQYAHAFIFGVLCVLFRRYGPFAEGTLLSLIAAQIIIAVCYGLHRQLPGRRVSI
ncbi:RnfABCDGE type electron transport complex subunit D [Klebsiella indica]|uniref:RnfABCDGE type electron transport complex subunit D n=1 Tax=Klebsiella indica TaxID=2582917 RepID=A0A5R9LFW2_9ENTR|nr:MULTISPECIES: RnfABCDGE type electron transport complex subunit D [Klebsiella]TLV15630.1 RnfABCDGE type electron transport complex subunit D [Klebsiella indica]